MELFDIDISYTSEVVADLQGKGKKVMCYVSAGTSEDFRDDINLFPEEVKGGVVSFGEGDTVSGDEKLGDPSSHPLRAHPFPCNAIYVAVLQISPPATRM